MYPLKLKWFAYLLLAALLLVSAISPAFGAEKDAEIEIGSIDAGQSPAMPVIEDNGIFRIGIVYGSDMKSSVAFGANGGATVGVIEKASSLFTPLWNSKYTTYTAVTTGDYFVRLNGYCDSTGEIVTAQEQGDMLLALAENLGCPACMGYSDGCCVALGPYGSAGDADAALSMFREIVEMEGGKSFLYGDVIHSDLSSVLLKNGNGKNAFYFQSSDPSYAMALEPKLAEGDSAPHMNYAGETYRGIFEIRRWQLTSSDGIEIINIVPLEHYVACVNAGEIYNTWDIGVHMAFAVTVRTYAVANRKWHDKKYGFDLCGHTCCQHYVGDRRISENILRGVENTKGQVLTYNGKICKVNYAAIAGGCTAKSTDVWGGYEYSYLPSVPTPWERFGQYMPYTSLGQWHKEYTGKQIYEMLAGSSYLKGTMKGEVVDVRITGYAENSVHVKSLQFTDCYGNISSLDRCEDVNIAMNFVSRGCTVFVCGKAGETVERPYYELDNFPSVIYGTGLSGIDGLPDVLKGKPVLKKTTVTLEGTEGSFVFDGSGWGHGVGLSQYGAWDMIMLGYDYQTVLAYYFPTSVLSYVKLPGEPVPDLRYDVNGDGLCSISDVTELLLMIANDETLTADLIDRVDINGDSLLSISDVTDLLLYIALEG